MSTRRKMLFAAFTLLVLLGVLEGAARLVWWRLEEEAFAFRKISGEKALRNDGVNYMKQADGRLGYVLKPGFHRGGFYINADGFSQREIVPLARSPGIIRLATLGESTTQGHDVDTANYPSYLRRVITNHGHEYANVEMINGGVSGWMSDQVALWAEHKIRPYRPDVVVLYVGWNDFQTYNPLNAPAAVSYFEQVYGTGQFLLDSSPFKFLNFASAAYDYTVRKVKTGNRPSESGAGASTPDGGLRYASSPEVNYRFFIESMDRIVDAFRSPDSKIHLAVCTLVGRWPYGPETDFKSGSGATWWMQQHGLDPFQAAAALARFNGLIRDYAKTRGLLLIDAESSFSDLERGKLQWDFAHLTPEGYELLAEVMYDELRSAGIVNGESSPGLKRLRSKYKSIRTNS